MTRFKLDRWAENPPPAALEALKARIITLESKITALEEKEKSRDEYKRWLKGLCT